MYTIFENFRYTVYTVQTSPRGFDRLFPLSDCGRHVHGEAVLPCRQKLYNTHHLLFSVKKIGMLQNVTFGMCLHVTTQKDTAVQDNSTYRDFLSCRTMLIMFLSTQPSKIFSIPLLYSPFEISPFPIPHIATYSPFLPLDYPSLTPLFPLG